jgi:hypothetical protein
MCAQQFGDRRKVGVSRVGTDSTGLAVSFGVAPVDDRSRERWHSRT